VIADKLLVLAKNSSTLDTVTNDVNTLAANISAPAATFDYKDATTVDIGTAGATDGITTNAGNITVTALGAGDLTLSKDASAGGATGTVKLDASAGGAVTETTGAVIADKLLVLAKNSSTLDTVTNDVNTLAANISASAASLDYKDATTVDIGTVDTTDGISTSAGNITVTALGTGNVTLSKNLSTGGATGTVKLDASAGGR